jgi:probable HAF family extracellular repeat protein
MSLWINDVGEAVGTSGTCADTGLLPLGHGAHPVLWDKSGSPFDIGKTNPAEEFGGIALGINNVGQVVGAGTFPDGSQMAFLWSRQAPLRKLVPLPGDVVSGAVSINERSDAVGQSFSPDGFPSPVLWQNGGVPTNLNDLAPGSPLFLLWPTSINGRGEISGFGVTAEGDVHGFLAIPNGALALDNAGSTALRETRRPVLSEKARSMIRSRFGGHGR